MRLWLVLLSLFSALACAPIQLGQPQNFPSGEFAPATLPSMEEEIYFEGGDSYSQDRERGSSFYYKPFPLDSNALVDKWVTYYSRGPGRDSMRRYLERSNRYRNLMQSMLRKEGLPLDIIYMSMLESGFYPYARSSQNAIGYWQFMYPTGRKYGLKINNSVDDRRDFVLSTQAAIDHLIDLYEDYKDWRLSMAAYNAGQPTVTAAINKHNSKNYWYLVSKKALPPQTRDYVPKVIAMRKIALSPERYGFDNLDYHSPLDYQLIALNRDSSLSHISRHLDIPLKELKNLNPKYKTDHIPLEGQKTHIRVPSYVRI